VALELDLAAAELAEALGDRFERTVHVGLQDQVQVGGLAGLDLVEDVLEADARLGAGVAALVATTPPMTMARAVRIPMFVRFMIDPSLSAATYRNCKESAMRRPSKCPRRRTFVAGSAGRNFVPDESSGSEPEIGKTRVSVGPTAERPLILAIRLANPQVVDAGVTPRHETVGGKLPVLVAVRAEPLSTVVVPFVGEAHRDPCVVKRPHLLDQPVVELPIPLSRQELDDRVAARQVHAVEVLERGLIDAGHACFVLDGDNMRHGLNRDLGFSPQARRENVRRVAETARLMNDAGLVVVTALISPYRDDRAMARAIVGESRFFETYLAADVAVCERRDPRGLYAKARRGEILDFTGVDAPYEVPDAPSIVLETDRDTAQRCVDALHDAVRKLIAV